MVKKLKEKKGTAVKTGAVFNHMNKQRKEGEKPAGYPRKLWI